MADLKNVNYIFKVDHGITSIMYRIRHIRACNRKITGTSLKYSKHWLRAWKHHKYALFGTLACKFYISPPPFVTGKSPGLARNITNIGWGLENITNMHCLVPWHINFTFLPPLLYRIRHIRACNRKITSTSQKYSKHWLRAWKHHKYALFGTLACKFYISPPPFVTGKSPGLARKHHKYALFGTLACKFYISPPPHL